MADTDTESDPVEVMESEALAELRDWLLNGAPCVSGGTYAAGVVSQRDLFKLFAHIDALTAKDQAAEAAGWVMAPRVATDAMIEAAVSCERGPATGIGGRYTIGDGVRDEYAAMIAASQPKGSAE